MITHSFNAYNNRKVTSKVVILRSDLTAITYFDLRFFGTSRDEQVVRNFGSGVFHNFRDAHIDTIKGNKEEVIDFLCGNNWPEYMEEFLQLIIQELT